MRGWPKSFDRFPVIWQHKGNASNLMIERTPAGAFRVHAIDQAVTRISDDANRAAYLDKVHACVAEARKGNCAGEHARRLRAFLEGAVDAKLADDAVAWLLQGVAEGADEIVSRGDDALRRAAEETANAYAAAHVPVSPHALDLAFSLEVREAMRPR